MNQDITQQEDGLLLQSLHCYQQELKESESGSLNGVSAAACRGLAEAQLRELDLESFDQLKQWSADQPVVWDEFERFLKLLGRENDQRLVIACFPPDQSKPMIHLPQEGQIKTDEVVGCLMRRPKDQLSLGMVINRPAPVPSDWGQKPDHFGGKRPSDRERKLRIWTGQEDGNKKRNKPRAWGASNEHIGESVAVWFEGDGGLPVAEQEKFHELIGLPPPTFTVWTGGKSLHSYYVLETPCEPAKSHFLMDWIGEALKRANPEAGSDTSLKNPCRVMRCPGGFHGVKGGRTYIRSVHPERKKYSLEELESALPVDSKPSRATRLSDLGWKNSQAARDNWWTRLTGDEQRAEAVLMMEVIEPRQKPSAEGGPPGTRAPALNVLGGLADYFGEEEAVTICAEAQWFNEWWDPAKELSSFNPKYLTIGTVINAAKAAGYLPPNERRRKEIRQKANTAAAASCSVRGEWLKTFDWMLTEERTTEVVIEEALKQQAASTGSELLYHQELFREYQADRGFYKAVSFTDLQCQISDLLRNIFEIKRAGKEEIIVKKQTTDAKAVACTKWMATTSTASRMDVVNAVAFANGTVHPTVDGWELRPHSADNRLTYSINGEWVPDADCPPYCREFFRTSYGLEWLHIIRAVLAYTADPRYVCRVLLVLLGLSGTGKGTMERLMESIFPPETVEVLQNFSVLNSPEKVAQYVCGNRLISFPDLQGHQTDLATLYSLTEGGLLSARHLYSRDTFSFAFTGRVVICAESVPTMENAGSGMARRLLTIPTKKRYGQSELLKGLDAEKLDVALQAEIGQLMSWALQMPRAEVEQVLRGDDPDGLLKQSRSATEVRMDATRAFIDQCIEPAEATTIPSLGELFSAYQLFCRAKGYRGVCNEATFKNRLRGALPHLHRERSGVPGNAEKAKVPAMFFGFRLIEGLWKAESYAFMDRSHETERGPVGSNWGVLYKPRFGEGALAELQGRALEIPTYAELKRAKIV